MIYKPSSNPNAVADLATIDATLRTLKVRAKRVPQAKRTSHFQMARRAILNAERMALIAHTKEDYDRAVQYLWDARYHLNYCE